MPRILDDIQRTVSDVVPFGLSVLALVLGIGPGWRFFWTLGLAEYDPTIAVLTATLVALIWTANYTFHAVQDERSREAREDERRQSARRSILSGVVAEFDPQDTWLEQVSTYLYHARVRKLDRPMLAEALRNAHLLDPNVTAVLAAISVTFQMIEGQLEKLADEMHRMQPDFMNQGVDRAEILSGNEVKKLQADIKSLREHLQQGAKLLAPEIFAVTRLARNDSDSGSDKPS